MKLGAWTIIIIGLAFFFIITSWATFWNYMPNEDEASIQRTYRDQLQVEADKTPAAVKRVQTAMKMVNERAAAWNQVVATQTPPNSLAAGGINVQENNWQLVVDSRKFRNNIQRAVNAQVKKGGVVVVNGPQVPLPLDSGSTILADFYNYPAIKFPVVIFDMGQVTVNGTYKQITNNVRAWSDMPHYLAVADGLAITGTSPHLTGTYSVSIVGYIRAKSVYPAVPEGAAAGANGGGSPALGGLTPGK